MMINSIENTFSALSARAAQTETVMSLEQRMVDSSQQQPAGDSSVKNEGFRYMFQHYLEDVMVNTTEEDEGW